MPTTAEVLQTIGKRGVVVGSVANGSSSPKDVDIVINGRGTKTKNPVYQDLLAAFRTHASSIAPGHLWIRADPLPVEVFEDNCWQVDDESKRAGQMTFRTAKRKAIKREILGASVLVAPL